MAARPVVAAGLMIALITVTAHAEVTIGGVMTQTMTVGQYPQNSVTDNVLPHIRFPDPAQRRHDENVHFDTDAEVHFTATGHSDHGLDITAPIELEADPDDDQVIDENRLAVAGNFGRLTLGSEDPAIHTHGDVGIARGFGPIAYYDDRNSYVPSTGAMQPTAD